MDDSLLVSLSSYHPRPDRRPIEDFLTEAFAWLLRTQDGLGTAFLEEEIGALVEEEDAGLSGIETIEWSTQASFSESRPDMVALADETALAFEHKIHEGASRDQLKRHREGLKAEYGGGLVVLITSAKWHYKDPADVKLTWAKVYQWLDRRAETTVDETMIREFQALLESRGLGPRSAIEETSLRAYLSVQELEGKIQSLFRELKDREEEWDFLFEQAPHLDRDQTETKWRKGTEGRLGIRFNPWTPGVYVGVLVDGSDHEVEMSNPDLGPDLVVVLDVSSDGIGEMSRQEYLQSPLYTELASRLQREASGRNWDVVDAYGRPEGGNAYHPLILRRSLAEVLRGTESFSDQVEAVLQALRNGVNFLLDDGRVRQAGEL